MGDTLETGVREDDANQAPQDDTSLANDPDMPKPGDVIDDRYEVLRVIGEGGFAAVYKCHDRRTQKDVAIKVLDPMMSRRGEFSQRFLREIRTVSQLRHHNTIKVTDAGKTNVGCLYLVMELLEGEALDEILDREGALPPARVQRIMSQVLKSLIEAHQDGVMHRDMKPANVFIAKIPGETDYVKVLDFGIAKSRDETADTSLTATGQVMCSPDYVAPERVRDHVCFFSSDLYSLGIMMLEMLEGELPYKGDTPIMVALQHARTDSPVPIKPYTLEGPLGAVVEKAVNKDASKRYQSAEEMLEDLMAADCTGIPAYDPHTHANVASAAGQTAYIPGGQTVTDLSSPTDVSTAIEKDGSARKPLLITLAIFLAIFIGGSIAVYLSMSAKTKHEDEVALRDEEIRRERAEASEAAAKAREEQAAAEEESEEQAPIAQPRMVNTSPQSARIYVNNHLRGETPYFLGPNDLKEFPLKLRFEHPAHKDMEYVFETAEAYAKAETLYFKLEANEPEPEPVQRTSRRSSGRSSGSNASATPTSADTSRSNSPPKEASSSSKSEKAAPAEETSKPRRNLHIAPRID